MTYSAIDLRASLVRVFQQTDAARGKPYIRFDGHSARSRFLCEGWNLAIDMGWITVETVELEQETFMKGFLTDKGKLELGLCR